MFRLERVIQKRKEEPREGIRCRANMAHTRQSRPDYGLGVQVEVLRTFKLFPFRSEAVVMTSSQHGCAMWNMEAGLDCKKGDGCQGSRAED